MPRRTRKHTKASSQKSIALRKPTARTQKAQIASLARDVRMNTRILAGVTYKVVHSTRLASNITALPGIPYVYLPLNAPSNMNQIFSAPSEAAGGKYNWDSRGRLHIRYNIVSNTEQTPLPIQVFIVSCKNIKVADQTGINIAGGPLQLVANTDYVNNIGAATFFNKKRFNVHKHWNVNLSPAVSLSSGVPAQWQGDFHPISRSFSMKQPLKLNNRQNVWSSTLDHQVSPNQRLFLVVFNNNLATSTTPTLNGMVISSAFTSE